MPALSSAANQEFTIIPTEKPLLISYCNLFYFVLKSNTSKLQKQGVFIIGS